MQAARRVLVALVLLAAIVGAVAVASNDVDAQLSDVEMVEPEMRDTEHIDAMAEEIGLAEVSSDSASDDEPSLMETVAASSSAEPYNFVMDDEDATHHVLVEAQSESGMSTMTEQSAEQSAEAEKKVDAKKKVQAAAKAPVSPKEELKAGNPLDASELLPIRTAPAPGEKTLDNTFRTAPVASVKAESKKVVARRLAKAKAFLDHEARQEHIKARKNYEEEVKKFNYNRSIEKARQSTKFERALPPPVPILPHPSSNAATFNGDRNHNVLFPAATLKSDGKAPSQDHDFQHRGDGDAYMDHTQLVEHSSEIAQAQQDAAMAEAEALAEQEQQVDTQAEAQATAEVEAEAAAKAEAEAAAQADAETEAAAETETETEVAADAETETEAEVTNDAEAEVAATEEAPAQTEEEEAVAPTIVKEPCSEQCDGAGQWRTPDCQDCIVRGMVNGWIVKSIVDKQRGYNYAHFARNKCVAYTNEIATRNGDIKGAPFSHCFFQKMHETCNL